MFNKKQKSVALSSAEAKYIATSLAACEGMWLRKLLSGLFECEQKATVFHCDNQSGIKLTKNPLLHDQSKKTDIRYHFLEIVYREEPFGWSTFKQMRRWLTFSL